MPDVQTQNMWRERVPRIDASVDVTTIDLDSRSAFVLSRIDGTISAGDIADMVQIPEGETIEIFDRLERAKAIVWVGETATTPHGVPSQSAGAHAAPKPAPMSGASASAANAKKVAGSSKAAGSAELEAALAEPGDLSRAERLRILATERDLREKTYWDVLCLAGNPTSADIKRAFFAASKRFHPDQFFGRDLGSFKARLDLVFGGIKTAYEVLGDKSSRAKYEKQHPLIKPDRAALDKLVKPKLRRTTGKVDAAAPAPDPGKARRLEERRAQIIAERQAKQNKPRRDKAKKADEMYELGVQQLRDKDLPGAAASFKLAAAYAPSNEGYQRQFKETNEAATAVRCKELTANADIDVATGQYFSAARGYAHASDLLPDRGMYAFRAAQYFHQGNDPVAALEYAERAVKAMPRHGDARVLLAGYLEDKGRREEALSHFEIAASLDKKDARAKKAIKRLSKKVT